MNDLFKPGSRSRWWLHLGIVMAVLLALKYFWLGTRSTFSSVTVLFFVALALVAVLEAVEYKPWRRSR